MLFTGGIGDFITIESFLNEEERNGLETIFYATRAHETIKEIISVLPNYPNLKNHIVLWDDFSRIFAFHNKEEVFRNLARRNSNSTTSAVDKAKMARWSQLLKKVEDMSISRIFAQIPQRRPYNNSSFLKYCLKDISEFILPGHKQFDTKLLEQNENKYFVICPYSPNDRRNANRDFNESDWQTVIKILKSKKMFGVVLNIGNDTVPNDSILINLSNKTNFIQSIEILKKASGYIGIDSSISVLATKLFNLPNLLVKSQNQHCYINKKVYYAPKDKFDFLVKNLST